MAAMFASWIIRSVLLFCLLVHVHGATQYIQRMMRNSNTYLSPNIYSNVESCTAYCLTYTSCTAASYQFVSGNCYITFCNNIDLVVVNGWISIVMISAYVETLNVLAPPIEWMLTDTCGTTGQGTIAGFTMNMVSIASYNPTSLGPYTGSSAVFSGDYASNGLSSSASVYFPLDSSSLTIMFWIRWNIVTYQAGLMELYGTYRVNLGTYKNPNYQTYYTGIHFYIFNGNLYFRLVDDGNSQNNKQFATYSLLPVANVWYHIALVYDGSAGLLKTYVNYILANVTKITLSRPYYTSSIGIGKSFYQGGYYLYGQLFCAKILDTAMTNVEVKALGQSCIDGKVRLSV